MEEATKLKAILAVILSVVILAGLAMAGCASRGEGLTLNGDGLHIGTSLSKRNQIAQEKADAEIAQIEARTVIEQKEAAEMRKVVPPVLLAVGLAAAGAVLAIGIGYAGQRAAPALEAALEVRRARSFQVGLTVSRDGCQATLTANGYDAGELAEVISGAPLLDAPRLQELQGRVGDRGMRLLAKRGEVEEALVLLPEAEVITDDEKGRIHD